MYDYYPLCSQLTVLSALTSAAHCESWNKACRQKDKEFSASPHILGQSITAQKRPCKAGLEQRSLTGFQLDGLHDEQ